MTNRQRIAVLGSTGSVGANTLDVIARHPDRFEVFALTAATRVADMLAQCERFRPSFAVMTAQPQADELTRRQTRRHPGRAGIAVAGGAPAHVDPRHIAAIDVLEGAELAGDFFLMRAFFQQCTAGFATWQCQHGFAGGAGHRHHLCGQYARHL